MSALLILLVGLIGLVLHQPWLYPSLGSTAYLLIQDAHDRSARFYSTVVGHLTALSCGIAIAALFGLTKAPGVFAPGGALTISRVEAASLALALTLLISFVLDASHPPAGATAMIVILGGFRVTPTDIMAVSGGVIAIASFGVVLRHLSLQERPLNPITRDWQD